MNMDQHNVNFCMLNGLGSCRYLRTQVLRIHQEDYRNNRLGNGIYSNDYLFYNKPIFHIEHYYNCQRIAY